MNKEEKIKKENFGFRADNQNLNVEVLDDHSKDKIVERYDPSEKERMRKEDNIQKNHPGICINKFD